jgi:hypothetical protein
MDQLLQFECSQKLQQSGNLIIYQNGLLLSKSNESNEVKNIKIDPTYSFDCISYQRHAYFSWRNHKLKIYLHGSEISYDIQLLFSNEFKQDIHHFIWAFEQLLHTL